MNREGGNMSEELTGMEKSELLGAMDGRELEDYDRDFYEAMYKAAPLAPEDVDDRIRRAIMRFIQDGSGPAAHPDNGGFVMLGFTHGYMVGRKLRKDIRRDAGNNPRTMKEAVRNVKKQVKGKRNK